LRALVGRYPRDAPIRYGELVEFLDMNADAVLTFEGGQEGQGGVPDYIYQENVPSAHRPDETINPDSGEKSVERVKSQLF
jgi:hypothetical protein